MKSGQDRSWGEVFAQRVASSGIMCTILEGEEHKITVGRQLDDSISPGERWNIVPLNLNQSRHAIAQYRTSSSSTWSLAVKSPVRSNEVEPSSPGSKEENLSAKEEGQNGGGITQR